MVYCQRSWKVARKLSSINFAAAIGNHGIVCKHFINTGILELSQEVQKALKYGSPLVALESTIITHGMPYPFNLRTAQSVEQIVRDGGGVPATVAVFDGKIHVGLTTNQLERLATCKDALKTSRRDLAWSVSQGKVGGTTVAATMIAAHLAGIRIFVTGGIGGVHRGGHNSMDISSDLTELGRTPVAVVCAGAKSILDIGRTLEYLETQGVTVATYGDSKYFPAFFAPASPYLSPCNISNATEAAQVFATNESLELNSGVLIAVPIPECNAKDSIQVEHAIQEAIAEAEHKVQVGKDVTPYILKRVNEITGGKALEANIALVKNNAKVGTEISVEYSKIRAQKSYRIGSKGGNSTQHSYRGRQSSKVARRPVVVGASIYDLNVMTYGTDVIYGGTTNPGSIQQGVGGVGRNIADCLSRLDVDPLFISVVGDDIEGQSLMSQSNHMDTSCITVLIGERTASYCAGLNGSGDVFLGVGDAKICDQITPELVSGYKEVISQAPLVCIDGNIPRDTIQYVCDVCNDHNIPIWYEPTCALKAIKPFETNAGKFLTYVSPNLRELRQMYAAVEGHQPQSVHDEDMSLTDIIRECHHLCSVLISHGLHCIILTLGPDGILVCRNTEPEDMFPCSYVTRRDESAMSMASLLHYPACSEVHLPGEVVSVSGAGDCLASGVMAGILQGHEPDICIKGGLLAANHSIRSLKTVPDSIRSQDFSVESIKNWAPWTPACIL
ncbi:pseudouridine-metabolizing bifunctional protein C1861.05-like [Anneissia japonica]|uniref:pseudouridine-metabolizing bifunctional protein C1861.05-like n=1 Tax=Anneissia japonica TaxID=1529436 RepID=UPI0014255E31|nr:pseudouridine-metabolizing bifunctional protein C1861.05-like [Anneissia japonica]XP_033120678.1 pseudouridine-metabolizing bifunctional protein C1861.05-like [Anneissia japonica]XP_033120689.1 pseudouridine-metabolizing bifunctional protein C1861.05-like [Anneissia japonica]XP_033120697.1 pseudouridine-metabolizing bifunctional protein C1861.05-like [Anneissia japonica]